MKYVKNKLTAGILLMAGTIPFIFEMQDITLTIGCIGLTLPILLYKEDIF